MAALLGIWWVWLSAALALALVEIMLPGFIFLGFAVGALGMALLVLVLPGAFGPTLAMAIFGGLSLLAWIGLRIVFRKQRSGAHIIKHDIND